MISISDVSPGHSLFKFVDTVWKNDSFGNNRSIHRLCTLMRKMGVQSAVTETLDRKGPLLHEEIEAIEKHLEQPLTIEAYRVTFFGIHIGDVDEIVGSLAEAISSTIILNLRTPSGSYSYIYQSFIKTPFKIHDCGEKIGLLNNYINIRKSFECSIDLDSGSLTFPIAGTFYCQQNTQTSVCAHATICMTLNNSDLYNGGLLTPEMINSTLEIDHIDKKVLGSLPIDDICLFLSRRGLNFDTHYFIEDAPDSNFSEYLYRFIESKCPSMLLFTTTSEVSHIVPVLGHTLNTDLWRPEAELAYNTKFGETNYRAASAWVDHWIMHDDNFGMYYCLPSDSFHPMSLKSIEDADQQSDKDVANKVTSFRAQLAISILPSGITLKPNKAEWIALTLLEAVVDELKSKEEIYWFKHLRVALAKRAKTSVAKLDPLVARTLLVSKAEFLSQCDREVNEVDSLGTDLPDRFWLVEFSIPDLYTANKSKIAEVAIYCDPNLNVSGLTFNDLWLFIHVPGTFILKSREGTEAFYSDSTVQRYSHIFRHNPVQGQRTLEW